MRIVFLCFCVIGLAGGESVAAQSSRPNFLIILADDLGFSDIGCYGGEIATPNLDALAANGLRYTSFYNTARCWPTRAALLTGYYAQQVRFDVLPGIAASDSRSRPKWAKLLPEFLRPLGYRSYHSGKWHLDGGQLEGGFDRSYTLADFNRNFSPQDHREDDQPLPAVNLDEGYYSTTAIADYAIRYLSEHAKNHAEVPFFCYVAFTTPHFPLHAPPEDIKRYRRRYLEGWDKIRAERWQRIQELGFISGELSPLEPEIGPPYHFPQALKKLGEGEVNRELAWNELTPEQQEFQANKMAIHAAMVDRIDQEVGRIVDQLRAMQALDDTLIVFFSDNGASAEIMVRGDGHDRSAAPGSAESYLCLGPGWSRAANTPFRRHKSWTHEGGIATPMVIHWPEGIQARGELRQAVGHVIDLAPTFLELAGGRWPTKRGDATAPPPPGLSLAPTFSSDVAIDREALWWLHRDNRALRMGDWKIVADKNQPWELYNLARDRTETHNLADQAPERVEEMAAKWSEMTSRFGELVNESNRADKTRVQESD